MYAGLNCLAREIHWATGVLTVRSGTRDGDVVRPTVRSVVDAWLGDVNEGVPQRAPWRGSHVDSGSLDTGHMPAQPNRHLARRREPMAVPVFTGNPLLLEEHVAGVSPRKPEPSVRSGNVGADSDEEDPFTALRDA